MTMIEIPHKSEIAILAILARGEKGYSDLRRAYADRVGTKEKKACIALPLRTLSERGYISSRYEGNGGWHNNGTRHICIMPEGRRCLETLADFVNESLGQENEPAKST